MEKKEFNLDYNIRPSTLGLENSKVIYLIHGYGADKNDLFSFANYLPESLTVIAMQATFSMPFGEGGAWYSLELGPNGEHLSNVEQAKYSVKEIESFIHASTASYGLDKDNIFVLGFSQGAILTYSMVLNNPDKFKYVLPLSGFIMDEIMPESFDKDYSNLDFYSAHGTMDGVISIERGRTGGALLKKLDIKHIYHEFPAAHSIAQKEFEEVIEWLNERV